MRGDTLNDGKSPSPGLDFRNLWRVRTDLAQPSVGLAAGLFLPITDGGRFRPVTAQAGNNACCRHQRNNRCQCNFARRALRARSANGPDCSFRMITMADVLACCVNADGARVLNAARQKSTAHHHSDLFDRPSRRRKAAELRHFITEKFVDSR